MVVRGWRRGGYLISLAFTQPSAVVGLLFLRLMGVYVCSTSRKVSCMVWWLSAGSTTSRPGRQMAAIPGGLSQDKTVLSLLAFSHPSLGDLSRVCVH